MTEGLAWGLLPFMVGAACALVALVDYWLWG